MACNCGSSWKPTGSGAQRARVYTIVQGDTVRRALSQSEAVVVRGQLLKTNPDIVPTIYAPGQYTAPAGAA